MSVVVVSGIFEPSGDRLIELQPARRRQFPGGPLPVQPSGRYVLEVTYATNERSSFPFDALVADDSGRTQHGFFEVVVPEDRPIERIEIVDTVTGHTLATMEGIDIVP
jgi:hypothetical protein